MWDSRKRKDCKPETWVPMELVMGRWARQFISLSLSFLGCEMDLVTLICGDDKRR